VNILITGGAGFIGAHLAEAMLPLDHEVVVVDDFSTGAMRNVEHLLANRRFRLVRGSVCDQRLMTVLVERADAIFHLAAAVGVQLIVQRPVHTISTNIHGTEVILELANAFRKKIIISSTSEVYGKSNDIPFREDADVVLGSTRFSRWSYACSKMVDEFLALAYYKEFGLQAIVCRFFNTIGARQTGEYGMVVPRFVRKALRNESIEIYGTGNQTRCFCNVADVVKGLTKLLDCQQALGEVINLGSDESITIKNLADRIVSMTGSTSDLRYLSYDEAYGQPFDDMLSRMPDLTKAQRLIGYKPKYSLAETLQQVIDFERSRIA
jgi:UDP-glucose 4-epimerase